MSARGAIVLIGFMGAGKTTAARELGARRGLRVSDVDQLIEAHGVGTVAEIFERDGERAFRAIEEEIVCELLARTAQDEVISLSGGAVGSERVRAALAEHLVVWLDVDPALAWRRAGSGRRPLARSREAFDERYRTRLPIYASLADAVIPSAARAAMPRAYEAAEQLRHAPPGARLLWAVSASAEYPVWIGRGVLGSGVWPPLSGLSRRFCVTDEHVAPLWLGRVGDLAGQIVIAPGETSKSLLGAEEVWSGLARAGMTRGDHLVALGGGVVGDLAGFCGATYQRGVPVVQAPTTLAAQVDSAYGGKTGIDLSAGKNYVGVYHQPAGVLVDPATLATLPAAELSSGYAEVIKTALIAGGTLWERIAVDQPIDDLVIFDCARCKLSIVAEDERDDGPRQVLNLGHTVAHAIETVTDYRRYRHGEAVGLGLLAALELSEAGELRDQVRGLLEAHGLPTRAYGVDPAAVLEAVGRDKKRVGATVPFVLVDAPGAVRYGAEVGRKRLEAALAEVCN